LAHQIPLLCAERHFKWDRYPHRLPCLPSLICLSCYPSVGAVHLLMHPAVVVRGSNLELKKTEEDEAQSFLSVA
jgi:hypothetical protein